MALAVLFGIHVVCPKSIFKLHLPRASALASKNLSPK